MSKKIEKLFKSYRDQLIHLAKLYGVVEIKSYARSTKRLTVSQLELILIKNRIKLPVNRSSDRAITRQELKENSYEPSNKELFIMLTNLNSKYDKLMNDYSVLKSYVDTLKNKINIIDYLNSECCSDLSIFQFINNININIDHLQVIFENGYLNGITSILLKYIDLQILENINIPIKAFTRKHQVCYINISSIDNLNDNQNHDIKYKWVILDYDNLYKLFNIINSKILNTFTV